MDHSVTSLGHVFLIKLQNRQCLQELDLQTYYLGIDLLENPVAVVELPLELLDPVDVLLVHLHEFQEHYLRLVSHHCLSL